jgi:hypothetical protein
MRRQEQLRKPSQLPDEKDIAKLRDHIHESIETLLAKNLHQVWSPKDYNDLRALVVARLTTYNARRGGEPSRLTLQEWYDAKASTWLPLQGSNNCESKITYQAGKGQHHMVPVIFPPETISAVEVLASEEVRRRIGIRDSNHFLFPYTQQSDDHSVGTNELNKVCKKAGLEKKVTATKMRHRASTLFASEPHPEDEENLFYSHMGHSREINKNVYQCPTAVGHLSKVGKFLSNIDKNIQGKIN